MAALLVAVVLGFFLYGRYRFQHFERDLPGRLGMNIQESTNGFSFTQNSHGHPLFTLKASKQIQLKSGHVLLHNVDITLYGPPGSGRIDHIFGSDFDYDQNQQIASSRGEVEIELQGASQPAANGGQETGANTIRVRTSGLTFLQKTGEASTAQPVEFQLPRAAGTSVGADYDSKTGVVVLTSQVHITTSSNGKLATIGATHATLEREKLEGFLVHPVMQFETESGSADAATVFFRKDGTTERVDAQGNVRMHNDTGATVEAATARFLLDAKSQPTQADLTGGVTFASVRPAGSTAGETMRGSARNATLAFASYRTAQAGTASALRHAEFRQDAHFTDETTGLGTDGRGRAERTMQGQTVSVAFGAPLAGHPPQAQTAVAEGDPVVTLLQAPSKGPAQTTRIRGDRLVATLGQDNALRLLDGTGHTEVDQSATDGSRDVSHGDTLHATFVQQAAKTREGAAREGPGKAAGNAAAEKKMPAGPGMQTVLATAVQDGSVTLTEVAAKRTGETTEPATLQGWAQHAEYTAADQLLHLSGHPRITDGQTMQMAAEAIQVHRDTQDAAAQGDVKATYTQPAAGNNMTGKKTAVPTMGGSGPVHVIAERAAMDHATNQTTFYGTPQRPARMWQDADSLLAPVLLIDRNRNVLQAWGAGGPHGSDKPEVNANFTTALGARHQPSVVRVRSQTLLYSDKDRRGDFRGSVGVEQGDGVLHCDDALVFLKPAPEKAKAGTPAAAAPTNSPTPGRENSQLDHLVATGHVVFAQPGRRGEGEKLLYTADDGHYLLTGTAAAPPTMWDQVHGTTTGAQLSFNSENDTVQVLGGKGSAVTNTMAPK